MVSIGARRLLGNTNRSAEVRPKRLLLALRRSPMIMRRTRCYGSLEPFRLDAHRAARGCGRVIEANEAWLGPQWGERRASLSHAPGQSCIRSGYHTRLVRPSHYPISKKCTVSDIECRIVLWDQFSTARLSYRSHAEPGQHSNSE